MAEPRALRLLRTIRFDASDDHVFEQAAGADEWAVSGAFAFADDEVPPAGKRRQAFQCGFLGTETFGRATLVTVAPIAPDERERVVGRLARHLVDGYGAPSEAAAREVAEAEVSFAAELATKPVNTLIAVERRLSPEGVVERFRTIERPLQRPHTKIWSLAPEDEGG